MQAILDGIASILSIELSTGGVDPLTMTAGGATAVGMLAALAAGLARKLGFKR